MTELAAMVLIVLLALSGYAAGRLHGQIGYRLGYRFGYRQGYFDGDRASWNRRRREMQAAIASVLSTPTPPRPEAYPARQPVGTTYTSHTRTENATDEEVDAGYTRVGRHAQISRPATSLDSETSRPATSLDSETGWILVQAGGER